MRKHMGMILLAALVLAAALTYTVTYTVASTDVTLVTTFGRVELDQVFDGSQPGQAGLKFKWPWPIQHLVRYDGRVFEFEDPLGQLSTNDQQAITVNMFCQWRIVDQVTFNRTIKTIDDAREDIRSKLRSIKGYVVAQHRLADFVNTDPQQMKLEAIEQEVTRQLRKQVVRPYGVEIVMVGIRSLGLKDSTAKVVIEAMMEEQRTKASDYEAAGRSTAQTIRSRALSASNQILDFARRKADDIRTQGEHAAAERYRRYDDDPEFAMFLRSLESLRKELASQTVILLDGSKIPAVKFFQEGPSLPSGPPAGQDKPRR